MAKRAHRRGAGVVGLSGEDELHTGLARDGVDHAKGAGFTFEYGALLNVKLEVGEGGVVEYGVGEFCGVEAEVADGVGDGDAVAVGADEGGGVERADQRETAEERFGETHPFFFREADDFDGEGHSLPCRARVGEHFFGESDAEDDAERAVEGACVDDRVQVRADEEPGCAGRGARQQAAEVADGVDVNMHSGCPHPVACEGVDAVHGWSEEGARGLAGDFGAAREFAAAGDNAVCAGCGGNACGLHAEFTQAVRMTRASMWPAGSSVGTKIWLGLSCPKRARSTSRQCLLGMTRSI